MPFILARPAGGASEPLSHPHQQQEGREGAEAVCTFEVSLSAPPRFEVRGWQSAADAPEDLPDNIRSRSVSLLACLDGQFVAVAVEQRSVMNEGERLLQVGRK